MANVPKRAAGQPRDAKGAPARGKSGGWRRFLIWSGVGLLVVLLAGTAGLGVAYATIKLPDPNQDFQTNTSFVYFNDGKEKLGSYSVQNRVSLAYKDIPQNVKDAIVAGENRSFWTDPGVSVPGLLRAALSLVTRGEDYASGGSTITQQYIKVMYLTQDRSFTRKFTEILLAAKMGTELSKEQILEGYLNTVYFGRGAYGIEAASQAYFAKSAKKLTTAQAVALTSIVNNPGNLDPGNGTKQAADLLERYQYTLNGLVEMGKLTEAQKNEIYWSLPKFPEIEKDSRMGGPKGFLLSMVQRELKANGFSDDQISGGGLQIVSTFNAKAQEAVVKAAQDLTLQTAGSAKKARDLHAAVASVDNATGELIAVYGGPDFVKNSRNWAITPRPVGSTFKPYALAAGLRAGVTLSDTFNGNTWTLPGANRPVTNAGGAQYGTVTLQTATTKSINTAYVDMLNSIPKGGPAAQQAAHDAGLPDAAGWDVDDPQNVTLGTNEVSPVDQAAGYATFANNGKKVTPHVVREVKDARGVVLYKAPVTSERTIEEDVAIDVNYALTQVTSDGTGARASALGYPLAGKTGTYYTRDADGEAKTMACWFVGYTRQISTAVMYVAGDEGTDDLDEIYPGFFGSGPPLSTWLAYMQVAQDGLPRANFDPPTRRTSTQKPTQAPPTKEPTKASPTVAPTTVAPTEPTVQPTTEPTTEPTVTRTPPGKPTPDPSVAPSP